MTINRRLPKQSPPIDPRIQPEIRRVLEYLKEQLDVGGGLHRGDKRDRWLRAFDLEDAGLGRFNPNLNGGTGGFEPGGGGGGQVARPTTPQNMTVIGGYDWIHVYWDYGHEWPTTEVWRASGSDNIADAVLVGTVGGFGHQYADFDVTYGVTYYYWVRFVGENGLPGPFTPPNGMAGKIVEAPEAMLSQLAGRIRSTQLHSTLSSYIDGIEVKADHANNQYTIKVGEGGAIAGFGLGFTDSEYDPENPNHSIALFHVDTFAVYSPSAEDLAFAVESVWDEVAEEFVTRVVMDGAHMSTGTITDAAIKNGTITNASIANATITSAKIQDAAIGSAKIANIIQSNSYVPDTSGWIIYKTGYAEFQDIKARGDIEATSIKADAVDIVDTLNISGNSVTSMQVRTGGGGSVSALGSTIAISGAYFPMPAGSTGVAILCTAVVTGDGGDGSNCQMTVRRNGSAIGSVMTSARNGWSSSIATIIFDTSPGANPFYSLYMENTSNGLNGNGQEPFQYSSPRMAILGAFR